MTVTDPCVNCVVFTQPTDFVVNVSESVNPATLQASDFTFNGNAGGHRELYAWHDDDNLHLQQLPHQSTRSQTMHIASAFYFFCPNGYRCAGVHWHVPLRCHAAGGD